jgi:hypothetical protein
VRCTRRRSADGWIVVATDGPDGRQVLLPAGITDAIDADARIVRVASAAELVRGGPEYEAGVGEEYRGRVATYYAGHRPG